VKKLHLVCNNCMKSAVFGEAVLLNVSVFGCVSERGRNGMNFAPRKISIKCKPFSSIKFESLEVGVNNRGYTLIELLTTIALIGIVATIASLSMRGIMEGYRLKGAARQIYGDLQLARLKAIKEGKICALVFSGNSYTIRDTGPDGQPGEAGTNDDASGSVDDVEELGAAGSDDGLLKTVDLAGDYQGISITSGQTMNIFYPNGTAGRLGGASTTVIVNNGSHSKNIKVNTGTGNVRIE